MFVEPPFGVPLFAPDAVLGGVPGLNLHERGSPVRRRGATFGDAIATRGGSAPSWQCSRWIWGRVWGASSPLSERSP